MHDLLTMPLTFMADSASAVSVMNSYVAPVMRTLCAVASIVCVFFVVNGGIEYMTSSGKPEKLEHAKRVLRNALLGLVVVLAAGTLVEILTHAYSSSATTSGAKLPQLQAIPPDKVSNGLVAVIIKAVTGFLNNIIQSVAQPFLHSLSFFTSSTELMANNSAVFNLWRVMVAITDALFVLVVALLGFHIMGAATFGFDEVEFKHLLPRFGLIFLGINTSIFAIDGIIEISNTLIRAVNAAGGSDPVWSTLSEVVKQSGAQSVAGLLLMVTFLVFSVILLVYYVGRLVTLYIGAVLSPIVLLAWLIPGFRDFSETAAKTYITTIFVLFVHVVILQLAASLFVGMAAGSGNNLPDTLMAMITGLATIIALLKTQGVMLQFSYVSMGSRNMKRLGGQFMNGVGYITGKATSGAVVAVASSSGRRAVPGTASTNTVIGSSGGSSVVRVPYKKTGGQTIIQDNSGQRSSSSKTGTTTVAPKARSGSKPSNSKDNL